MLKILKSNTFLISLLIIVVVIFIWLINFNYFGQVGDLDKLLPNNTLVSANLDLSELNATINQKNKLNKSEFVTNLLLEKRKDSTEWLKSYNLQWEDLKKHIRPQASLYFTSGETSNWGLLAQANNKQIQKILNQTGLLTTHEYYNSYNIYKITSLEQAPIYFTFINNKIISICSDTKLCQTTIDNYRDNKSTGWQKVFSTITLKSLITIKINPEIKNYLHTNPLLPEIYQVIEPLIHDGPQELLVEINQQGNKIVWQIINRNPSNKILTYSGVNIKPILDYIHLKSISTLAVDNISKMESINNSPLYQSFAKSLANRYNTALVTIIDELDGMIALSFQLDDNWLLLASAHQEQTISDIAIASLAKLQPQTINKTLPDNTRYTELVANPDIVEKEEINTKNGKIITLQTSNGEFSFHYYLEGGFIILSNDINTLQENRSLNSTYQYTCNNEKNIQSILYLDIADWTKDQKDNELNLNFNEISKFKAYSQGSDENIVITGCLELK